MHTHAQHPHGASQGAGVSVVLRFSLLATFLYIILLVVTGIRAHSLALLSEAGHNLSDFLALLLSWVAVYVQTLQPSDTKTYGYHRAGVLAAFVNAITLVVVSIFIFIEVIHGLLQTVAVQAALMMWVAGAGVVMNGLIAALL